MKATTLIGRTFVLAVVIVFVGVASLSADPFTAIRIGDIDGFDFGDAAGLMAASGGPANVDGVGNLHPGDFLPDGNGDGYLKKGSGDDFDHRSAAEIAGSSLTGSGYTDMGTTGSQFTDISLSTTFDDSFPDGNFPLPPSADMPNQPGFVFDFFVATGDITAGVDLFFNLVFADYDVTPAQVDFIYADGSTGTKTLTIQDNENDEDGLIQAAFVSLSFSDVFVATLGGWQGSLAADFVAPREPYTAFDYAEIGTEQIPVPEPSTILLVVTGLAGLAGFRKKFKS